MKKWVLLIAVFIGFSLSFNVSQAAIWGLTNTACDSAYVTAFHNRQEQQLINAHNAWAKQIQKNRVDVRQARKAVDQLRNSLRYFQQYYHPLHNGEKNVPALMLQDLQQRMLKAGWNQPQSIDQGLLVLKRRLGGSHDLAVVGVLQQYARALLPLYEEGVTVLANDAETTQTPSCQRLRQNPELNKLIVLQGTFQSAKAWWAQVLIRAAWMAFFGFVVGLLIFFLFGEAVWVWILSLSLGSSAILTDYLITLKPFEGFGFPLFILSALLIGLLAWRSSIKKEVDTHGSARWSTTGEAKKKHHIFERQKSILSDHFILGNLPNTGMLYSNQFEYMGHVLTCAPTGAGKGVGAVIPHLLTYKGSAVVLDIKGENYAVTAEQRRRMGHTVVLIDPFKIVLDATRASYNWLARLNPSDPSIISDAAMLADMLVSTNANSSESSHWEEAAKDLIKGIIIYVAGLPDPKERNIVKVRQILAASDAEQKVIFGTMAESSDGFGVIASSANAYLSKADKERSGVMSSARQHTAFLDDTNIQNTLLHSDFDLGDLKSKSLTLYIAMPPSKISSYHRYLRALVGLSLEVITHNSEQPKYKVAFFLDEFAQLGHMRSVEDGISLLRGYGAAFWIFVQDLSQLKAVYPKWQTFLANTTKQFFGTADVDTAKYLSETLGEGTVGVKTKGKSQRAGRGTSQNSVNEQWVARSLLTPDEIMMQGPENPIIIIAGERPYRLKRINYLKDKGYKHLAAENPYYS
jgi:type IV secretion system protein VirD4